VDIPISELEPLLQSLSAANTSGVAAASDGRSHAEINGQRYPVRSESAPGLNAVARRIASEGRLISFPHSAAELIGPSSIAGNGDAESAPAAAPAKNAVH
jgi:hypothetical protein